MRLELPGSSRWLGPVPLLLVTFALAVTGLSGARADGEEPDDPEAEQTEGTDDAEDEDTLDADLSEGDDGAEPLPVGCATLRRALIAEGPHRREALADALDDPTCPPDERRDGAHLLGRLALESFDHDGALAALERAAEANAAAPSPIADILAHDLARALAARDDADSLQRALALLPAVLGEPHSPLQAEATYLEADLLTRLGRDAEAEQAMRRLLEIWPDDPLASEIRLRLGAEPPAEAILRDLPWTDDLHASLMRTRHLPSPLRDIRIASLAMPADPPSEESVDARPRVDMEIIDALIRARRHADARLLLAPWIALADSDAPEDRRQGLDALERLMDIAWEEHRFAEVLATNARLARAGRKKKLSRYKEARSLAYEGDLKGAISLVKRAGIRAEHADLLFEFGLCEEAVALLHAPSPPKGKKAKKRKPKARPLTDERVALCLVHLGRGEEAAPFWESTGKTRRRGRVALHARYWYARALLASGQRGAARARLETIVADDPVDYYGHAAWSRLQELNGSAPELTARPDPQITWRALDAEAYRPTIAWTEEGLTGAFDRAPSPESPEEIERLAARMRRRWGQTAHGTARAEALLRIGERALALDELRVVDTDMRVLRRGPAALVKRSRSDLYDNRATPRARGGAPLGEGGRYTEAQAKAFKRNAKRLRDDVRAVQVALADPWALRRSIFEHHDTRRLDQLEPDAAVRMYPLAYPDVVAPLTRQFGLPPYYVYAIMATESAFHPAAVSVANAYGLVQVIPATGRHLARELGYFDFAPERLLDPGTSIYFGGYYLARLLNRFRGQELLAAAGYNAGPHRVVKWLRARGHLAHDIFVELIPYKQARNYAKRIVEHVGSYRRVYHGEANTYLRNTLTTELGDGPNY